MSQYTFRERCDECPELELGDGTEKHFYNCNYRGEDITEGMRHFYDYVKTGITTDDLTNRINRAVIEGRRNGDLTT